MIQLDGSKLEGGGAVLRTATALSAITEQPLHLINVRKGRKNSGLRPQHLSGLRAVSDLCNADLRGDELNSKEITFKPGQIRSRPLTVNIKTAGSITLALQGLIPPALQAPEPVEIHFKGGATDTFFSPTLNYFQQIFLKHLKKTGITVDLKVKRRGYYPEGEADLTATVQPGKPRALHLNKRGRVQEILISSGAATQLKDKEVAERQVSGAEKILPDQLPIKEEVNYYRTECPGSHISLTANFGRTIIGTDNIGKLGKKAEKVGKEAASELLKEQKAEACLDKHMADQILIYMALAEEESKVTVSEITDHCKTNIWIIEEFLEGHFETEQNTIRWKPS